MRVLESGVWNDREQGQGRGRSGAFLKIRETMNARKDMVAHDGYEMRWQCWVQLDGISSLLGVFELPNSPQQNQVLVLLSEGAREKNRQYCPFVNIVPFFFSYNCSDLSGLRASQISLVDSE